MVSLIHHNLVVWEREDSTIRYSFDVSAAIALVRVPRYLQVIRDIYNVNSETVIEEIVNCGRATLSQLLFRVGCRVHEDDSSKLSLQDLRKDLFTLRAAGFIERCPAVVDPETYLKNPKDIAPTLVDLSSEPEINMSLLEERIRTAAKDEGEQPDRSCFWRLNVKRFDIQLRYVLHSSSFRFFPVRRRGFNNALTDCRDMLVSDAATRRTDELGGALVRSMLMQLAHSTSTHTNTLAGDYSFFVLKSDMVKLGLKSLAERLRDYLEVLRESP